MEPHLFDADDQCALQAIRYKRGHLELLDQRRLPLETVYLNITDAVQGWHAIKDMVVRGAPAIAIAAVLSLAVETVNMKSKPSTAVEAVKYIHERLEYLVSSRLTAVNLSDAAAKMKEIVSFAAASASSGNVVLEAFIEAAENMLASDVAANMSIGTYGAELILNDARCRGSDEKLCVLTHCNTGSLATAGYGTALGVIRSLHSKGELKCVYCTETRPFNQGSRLTAYELVYEKIPAILIADSAVAALQVTKRVDAVIVGADRIAVNGETANKIGTYNLALSAFHHGIPFYVAAPLTSVDKSLKYGQDIVIEERSPKELTHSYGGEGPQVAASGISVWNPAFDVTPARLITAIITDKGVITKAPGSTTFDILAFCEERSHKMEDLESQSQESSEVTFIASDKMANTNHSHISKFHILNLKSVVDYIKDLPNLVAVLGEEIKDWSVKEVGDGNLNFVYIVLGSKGSLVLKQSIPYVRCVGESWPMTPERSYYEAMALRKHGSLCPQHVPQVYYYDRSMSTVAMEYLKPPHIILRKGLIKGISYPLLADHVSEYMAKTLFSTSLLAISTMEHKSLVAQFCGNVELCRLTEQVIFTEPYMEASNNRWTSPQLDEDVKSLHEDLSLKMEIADLKAKFCERSQALIHGDLHTGSIMVTAASTKVIDPEFAFYGPIGFDVGAFLGNLLLAYFAQDGHANRQDNRQEYKKWILTMVRDTWTSFEHKFLSLWMASWDTPGDLYPSGVYNSHLERLRAQEKFMREIFEDTLGFAAAKMIRRIVGIAHVEDFESIDNPDKRAVCERQALKVAKILMKQRSSIMSIQQVINLVE